MKRVEQYPKGLDTLQKISVSLMAVLVLVTFLGANLQAVLWQSSSWLVSTVLPAVVVDLTNEERTDLNAPVLVRNPVLDEAARLKAQHMAENEYFAHYSPTGVSPWYWFDEAGYVYAHAGENLAIHFTDSSEVVDAWMNSPAHRANIVDTKYSEIGVGTAKGTFDGYDTVYVVQLFGTPAFVAPAVEPEPAPTAPDNTVELAEIAATLDELAAAVEELENPIVVEETPEVLAETVVEEVVSEQELEPEEVVVVEEKPSPEPVEVVKEEVTETNDVLVVESAIATSSGLTAATVQNPPLTNQAGTTMVSIATQPNQLLQFVYVVLAMVVMGLLLFSAVFEARKLHFVQVTYSIGLMASMGALWYVHTLLTSGAVIA